VHVGELDDLEGSVVAEGEARGGGRDRDQRREGQQRAEVACHGGGISRVGVLRKWPTWISSHDVGKNVAKHALSAAETSRARSPRPEPALLLNTIATAQVDLTAALNLCVHLRRHSSSLLRRYLI